MKPPTCAGCALATTGEGWIPPTGPRGAKITFLAEAPGQREAAEGKPLVGEAGAMFHRLLGMLGRNRAEFRLANCLHCRPPRNWLEGAPWEEAALTHCRPNLDQTLAEGSSVVVALGGVALRSLLGMGKRAKATVKEFHGSVVKEPGGRFWVVTSFHPIHLQRGAHNLTGVVLWDIRRALKVAAEGFTPDEPELVVDPTLEWFSAWVDDYLTRAEEVWLAVDTEFPGKTVQEDEQTPDASWNLTRVNLAWHPDLGVTVPADPPYMRLVAKALASPGVKVFWHHRVDTGRLAVAGAPVSGPIWDAMDATHVLQSDVPRSLGFWAPFYSDAAPWKHENAENPGPYAAKDAAQTLRIMHGAAAHLQQEGQWEVFERHFALFDQWVTVPAETVGLLVDPEELPRFTQRLLDEETRLEGLQKPLVPSGLGLTHTWKRKPETDDQGRAQVDGEWYPLQETVVTELVRACLTCGAKEVVPKHRCKDAAGKPDKNAKPQVELVELPVTRWWVQLPFNPQSPPQMLQLLATWKLAPGKDKKTGRPSANKECLVRCRKSAKRPEQREFFGYELDRRAVAKVEGTYASGTIRRLREQELRGVVDGRLHSSFPNKPSTFRLSSVDPNLQNVKADKAGGGERPEAGFRRCIVAAPGCSLAELDWAAIEAVMVAWFAGDPVYYRLAKLGVHAYMASHALGRPADLAWDDDKLAAYFKEIKGSDDPKVSRTYNACKRTVHGVSYGLTPYGMNERMPDLFPTIKVATWYQDLFFSLAPKVRAWQRAVQERAAKERSLGGPGSHPFGYKFWFWDVFSYRKITAAQAQGIKARGGWVTEFNGTWYLRGLGTDAKRVVATMPQSGAAGVMRETCLRLFVPGGPSYIGDAWYGQTPLRAIIHDSLLLELPDETRDQIITTVAREMTAPITQMPLPEEWGFGPYVTLGVDIKVGKNWGEMEKWKPSQAPVEVAVDTGVVEYEEEEGE